MDSDYKTVERVVFAYREQINESALEQQLINWFLIVPTINQKIWNVVGLIIGQLKLRHFEKKKTFKRFDPKETPQKFWKSPLNYDNLHKIVRNNLKKTLHEKIVQIIPLSERSISNHAIEPHNEILIVQFDC